MSGQVDFRKASVVASQVVVYVIPAISSGFVLAFLWTASLGLGLVFAVLLFGVGLFQLIHRKAPLARTVSIGIFFGLLVSSGAAFYGLAVRNSQALSVILGTMMYGPDDFTDAEAKSYFDQHEQTFTALVELISQCEGNGTTSIYPDGHVFAVDSEAVKCPSTQEISKLLKSANILWVLASSNRPYGEQGPFSAMFVLSSRGIVGHGSGSAIYYFPELETNPFGDSFALQGTPGHWFYRRTSSAR